MYVVLLLIEPVSGTLVDSSVAATRGEGAKVLQQRPASQTQLAVVLVAVKSATGIQQAGQAVHQSVDQIAGAMRAGVIVADHILRRSFPQLGDHFLHRRRPGSLLEPLAKHRHPLAEFIRRRRTIHVPHLPMQPVGFAAAVANLQETVQEAQDRHDSLEQNRPSVARVFPG